MSDAGEKTLKQRVDDIAGKFADDLIAGKEPSKQALDTFKSLCQYLVADRKLNPPGEDEGQGDTFNGFRDKIRAA